MILEHIERTGVHSGDSISVYPHFSLSNDVAALIIEYTNRITRALEIIGLVNVQYAYDGKKVYVCKGTKNSSNNR